VGRGFPLVVSKTPQARIDRPVGNTKKRGRYQDCGKGEAGCPLMPADRLGLVAEPASVGAVSTPILGVTCWINSGRYSEGLGIVPLLVRQAL